jgi:hypothetical protein
MKKTPVIPRRMSAGEEFMNEEADESLLSNSGDATRIQPMISNTRALHLVNE